MAKLLTAPPWKPKSKGDVLNTLGMIHGLMNRAFSLRVGGFASEARDVRDSPRGIT